MSANIADQFQLVKEKGWRRGLGNLLHGEYSVCSNLPAGGNTSSCGLRSST